MITHDEIAAGLCLLVPIAGYAGLLIGHHRPSPKRLEDEYHRGRNRTIDEAIDRVERRGMVFRLSPDGVAAWCDAGSEWDIAGAREFDARKAYADEYARDAGEWRDLFGDAVPESGHYPDGREYPTEPGIVNAELAALADPPDGPESDSAGSSASPYPNDRLTPAQRRRDKHKRRGAYSDAELPDPPTDLGAWWADELADLLRDGQSDWFSRNMAGMS